MLEAKEQNSFHKPQICQLCTFPYFPQLPVVLCCSDTIEDSCTYSKMKSN